MDLLDSLDIGVLVLSPAGEVEQCSATAAALLGAWVPVRPAGLSSTSRPIEQRHTVAGQTLALRFRQISDGRIAVRVQAVQGHADLSDQIVEALWQLSSVGLWSLDMDALRPWWSPVVCQIHEVPEGFAPTLEEAIQFYAPEARPVIQAAVQDAIQNGAAWDHELPLITATGRHIWVRAVGRSVQQDGRCVQLVGSFQDITARKNTELQLRRALAQARRYETLFESANALVAIASYSGHFVQVNESWRRVLGYPTEALLERPILSIIHPADLSTTIQSFARLQQPPYETVTFQTRAQTASGEWLWLSWCCATDPVTGYIYAVVSDITEMHRVQAQLHRLAMIAQHTKSAVLITDSQGRIEWVNAAFTELTGYSLAEVLGRRPGRILQGPETDPQTVRFMRQQIAAGEGFKTEILNYRKDGAPYWLTLEVQPMRDSDGVLVGFMSLNEDISERKQAEEALIDARNRAETLAASAERANAAKSSFLAMMSHELRTPMNGVLGMAQLLEQTALDETQRTYVEGIHSSGTSLLAILNDILDFSKIEAGYLDLNPEPFALQELLEGVQQLLRTSAAGRGLALNLSVDPALPERFVGDALRLRQIVLNLVGNALKFTERGNVDIRATSGEAGAMRIEVEDTGVGISPEAQAHLFQPFSQVDTSATRRFSGTGLGLAICRQLVELMGGLIGVRSTLGEGSCFWLEVPLPILISAPTPTPETPATAVRRELRDCTVLLVEDHRINQVVARHMLERLGCRVTLAGDGVEALDALAQARFDVVLMDCHMPNLDGWETTRRFRAAEATAAQPRTPIVALTANAMHEDREACLAAGMDDYLSKPLQQELLRETLARWCDVDAAGGDVFAG